MKLYLFEVLIYISLMTNDVEYLFLCFLAICISSLEKCLVSSFAYFTLGYLSFYYLVINSLYSLDY